LVAGGSSAATIAWHDVSIVQTHFQQREQAYLVEHILQFELRESRTLNVLDGAKVLGHALAILFPHRLHLLLAKLLAHLWVVAQICLGADDEARHTGAVVVDFGEPLLPDVLETGG
jgi:hypothetical protein